MGSGREKERENESRFRIDAPDLCSIRVTSQPFPFSGAFIL